MNRCVDTIPGGYLTDQKLQSVLDLSIEQIDVLQEFFILQERSLAPNSLRGLKTDIGHFISFCRDRGLIALPASIATIRAFVRCRFESEVKGETIARNLSAISKLHDAVNVPNACRSELVKSELKAVRKQRPQRKKQAVPLRFTTIWQWDTRIAQSTAIADIRDRAMIWCFYDCLLRGDELQRIEISWVEFLPDGDAVLHIPTHKGDQEGLGSEAYLSRHTVIAMKRWLHAAGISSGKIFRSFSLKGEMQSSISTNGIRQIISNRGYEMGVVGATNHSFRVGATQDLVEAGESTARIQLAGRWKSDRMVMDYSRNQRAQSGAMAELSRRQGRN